MAFGHVSQRIRRKHKIIRHVRSNIANFILKLGDLIFKDICGMIFLRTNDHVVLARLPFYYNRLLNNNNNNNNNNWSGLMFSGIPLGPEVHAEMLSCEHHRRPACYQLAIYNVVSSTAVDVAGLLRYSDIITVFQKQKIRCLLNVICCKDMPKQYFLNRVSRSSFVRFVRPRILNEVYMPMPACRQVRVR